MYGDYLSYLVNEWWGFSKHYNILKGLSNENNPP
jgi:hypothetical protein